MDLAKIWHDLARGPRRAPLTARKKGSGYENGCGYWLGEAYSLEYLSFF